MPQLRSFKKAFAKIDCDDLNQNILMMFSSEFMTEKISEGFIFVGLTIPAVCSPAFLVRGEIGMVPETD